MFRQNWFSFFWTVSLAGAIGCGDPPPPPFVNGDPTPTQDTDFEGFAVAPPPGVDDPGNGKDTFEEKLAAAVDSAEVPSAFAGAFVQLSRAYISGRDPVTQIELSAFEIFDNSSPDVIDAISRMVDRIDEMPAEDMERLYGAQFLDAAADQPLTHSILASALATEIHQRAALIEFGPGNSSRSLDEESGGLQRQGSCYDIDAGAIPGFCPNICSIRTPSTQQPLRTAGFVPYLSAGEYSTDETERECEVDQNGNLRCHAIVPPDCKGQAGSATVNPVCLAVPLVQAGEMVTVTGFNFFDTEAVVSLIGSYPSQVRREVSAHVIGDNTTPADAPVDCGISDRVYFQVPSDLPVGIYHISVGVTNPERPERRLFSSANTNPYIEVVPPRSTRFSMTSEELTCIDQTDGEWGSDEIGLKVITIPVAADGSIGEMLPPEDFDFGDVDRGERRTMDRVHFSGPAGGGFGFTIIGFEIDNREAYEQTVRGFAKTFDFIARSNWGKVAGTVGTIAGGFATYFGGPLIGSAVAGAITAALTSIVALWAPADLVIEDFGGMSFLQLAELTSLNVANPPPAHKVTEQGVKVLTEPCQDSADEDIPGCDASAKAPGQYRERRLYEHKTHETCPPGLPFCNPDVFGSRYQITFRYNRLD